MECPKCHKTLERKTRKGEVIYPCDECDLEVQGLSETKEYRKQLNVNELVELRFREPETQKVKDSFLTTVIPELDSLVGFGPELYRVTKKVYQYWYVAAADKTDVRVDVFITKDDSFD